MHMENIGSTPPPPLSRMYILTQWPSITLVVYFRGQVCVGGLFRDMCFDITCLCTCMIIVIKNY